MDLSIVISSSYRRAILKTLARNIGTPSSIAQETNKSISHVSRALKELCNMSLVECVTPDRRKGKIYKITAKGIKILELMNKIP